MRQCRRCKDYFQLKWFPQNKGWCECCITALTFFVEKPRTGRPPRRMSPDGTHFCNGCERYYPETEEFFYRWSRDGQRAYSPCRSCERESNRKRQQAWRDQKKAERTGEPDGDRRCTRCDTVKRMSEFYNTSVWCKDCVLEYQRKRYRKLRDTKSRSR